MYQSFFSHHVSFQETCEAAVTATDPTTLRFTHCGTNSDCIIFSPLATVRIPPKESKYADVEAVAFHPSVPIIAIASSDASVSIFSLRGPHPTLITSCQQAHTQGAVCVAWHPCGYQLISGGRDARVLWCSLDGLTSMEGLESLSLTPQMQSPHAKSASPVHTDTIYDIAFIAPSQILISVDRGGTIAGWSPAAVARTAEASDKECLPVPTCLWKISGAHQGEMIRAIAPFNDMFCTVGRDDALRLWKVTQEIQPLCAALGAHSNSVTCVDVTRATRIVLRSTDCPNMLIATGGGDDIVRVWDIVLKNDGGENSKVGLRLITELFGHRDSVLAVAFAPNEEGDENRGHVITSTGRDATVMIWYIPAIVEADPQRSGPLLQGRTLHRIELETKLTATCIRFSPDNTCAAVSEFDGTVRLFDARRGRVMQLNQKKSSQKKLGHLNTIRCLAVDGDRILSGGRDKALHIWKTSVSEFSVSLQRTVIMPQGISKVSLSAGCSNARCAVALLANGALAWIDISADGCDEVVVVRPEVPGAAAFEAAVQQPCPRCK